MKRKRDTELVVPICYGTCAYYLGKKADEYHSHKWTVYLREPEHGDLSHVISKVVFNLHPSFKEPVRTLEKPPYEVTETGWGEFEIAQSPCTSPTTPGRRPWTSSRHSSSTTRWSPEPQAGQVPGEATGGEGEVRGAGVPRAARGFPEARQVAQDETRALLRDHPRVGQRGTTATSS